MRAHVKKVCHLDAGFLFQNLLQLRGDTFHPACSLKTAAVRKVSLGLFLNQFLVQLEEMRKNEDPRLSFSTPEFKEAQRIFTEGFKVLSETLLCGRFGCSTLISMSSAVIEPWTIVLQKNFGKPVEWGLVKDYAWSTPQLRKLDVLVIAEPLPFLGSLHTSRG